MGFSSDGRGKPEYDENASFVSDLQGAVDFAEKIGGLLKGTPTERAALSAGNLLPGWLFVESTTGDVYRWTGSAWVAVYQFRDWVTLTAASGWTAGTGTNAPQVSRDGTRVTWRGSMFGGGAGTDTTTVPSGFRPGRAVAVPFVTASNTVGIATVFTNGVVQLSDAIHARAQFHWSVAP